MRDTVSELDKLKEERGHEECKAMKDNIKKVIVRLTALIKDKNKTKRYVGMLWRVEKNAKDNYLSDTWLQ